MIIKQTRNDGAGFREGGRGIQEPATQIENPCPLADMDGRAEAGSPTQPRVGS